MQIEWRDNNPYSQSFDDIYFHPKHGLAESRYVFIEGNKLQERFACAHHFTIAELGFGTGLNLLASWHLFRAIAPENAMLHYISFEAFPLTPEDMLQAVSCWPEMAELAQQLYPALRTLAAGIHRFHAPQLVLTLVIGNAQEWLPQLSFAADAWFLDGFAPAKNPDMWSAELLHHVARCTAHAGTLATFSAAGHVRQSLAEAGFYVQKIKGFGNKRHMTTATLHGEFCEKKIPEHIAIIGGGIAGCSAAHALAMRGVQVTLFESSYELAAEASGNPAGALYPPLHKQWSPAMQFYWDALAYMHRQLPLWQSQGLDFDYQCYGMLKLPTQDDQRAWWPTLPERLGLTAHRLAWRDDESALFIAQSGWVNVAKLCKALVQHPNITVKTNHKIELLPQRFDVIVIANASAAKTFFPHLPLHWNRGQLSYLEPHHQQNNSIISHKGYTIFTDDQTIIGATYDRNNEEVHVREEDHQENIQTSHHYAPAVIKKDATVIGGRASLRSVTPDRLPIIGEIEAGVFLSAGHGSRGLLSAPFGAQIIADLIFSTPCPTTTESQKLLSPKRFV